MSSDLFEKNVGDLVRRGALRPDEARARERFLQAVDARPERLSWKLAAAAAATLVAVVMFWSARIERPKSAAVVKDPPPLPSLVPARGGDGLLEGTFTKTARALVFDGRSALPDGLVFTLRLQRLEEQLAGNRLVLSVRESGISKTVLEKGAVCDDWPHAMPGPVRLDVAAPDALQDTTIVKRLRVPESKRRWTFEVETWDAKLHARLGPQLAEVADLAREARELVSRVEESCAAEGLFKERLKELAAAAAKLQARSEGFAKTGLYPAATNVLAWTARDLSTAMQIFTWKEKKFAGPRSYYTNGDLQKTSWQEPFAFDALKRYLDLAVAVGGRELVLWTIKDFRRSMYRAECRAALKENASRPGVAEFAPRLFDGKDLQLDDLEAEVRLISK